MLILSGNSRAFTLDGGGLLLIGGKGDRGWEIGPAHNPATAGRSDAGGDRGMAGARGKRRSRAGDGRSTESSWMASLGLWAKRSSTIFAWRWRHVYLLIFQLVAFAFFPPNTGDSAPFRRVAGGLRGKPRAVYQRIEVGHAIGSPSSSEIQAGPGPCCSINSKNRPLPLNQLHLSSGQASRQPFRWL